MSVLDMLADAKIAAAIEAGELANLPGAGKPLDLGEDPLVPDDLRVAWRFLKNSGFVPPEIAERREGVALVGLLATIEDEGERRRAAARLALLELRREAAGTAARLPAAYRGALLQKFGRASG
ncbi:MAG: DUF1992 domain-containing protein [Burkholderiales bacterium]|nr:DUF1992 domain-containing protein [Burkholderiales bacterium]MBP6564307.1 DUF1992 domain-containing protein [Burkholderiales bacterium]